ncbi:MAG: sulfide/dihydroorotate dehydrogenase-like FAD/NAD-binding protein [Erysipelothrix sp.]|nr:sulfide/dihydroorotate dehydrogenase-like FAD/NAD-binding protein [Erysipelothrix sp.]
MAKILKKEILNSGVVSMEIEAPRIAAKAKAGNFVMIRIDEHGERFPLTIADSDKVTGSVRIIFQVVGGSTIKLNRLEQGDEVRDIVGPLGMPVHHENIRHAIVIGGGVGCAIAYPHAKALKQQQAKVSFIAGFRNKDLFILQEEINQIADQAYFTTDDGSAFRKGFVTDVLKEILEKEKDVDLVIAIGPVVMMKAVARLTQPYQIKTVVSLNPIMIDGTGMCGGCRVKVGNEYKFACVDGPEFDGHLVDFDELILRNSAYVQQEKHLCKLIEEDKT